MNCVFPRQKAFKMLSRKHISIILLVQNKWDVKLYTALSGGSDWLHMVLKNVLSLLRIEGKNTMTRSYYLKPNCILNCDTEIVVIFAYILNKLKVFRIKKEEHTALYNNPLKTKCRPLYLKTQLVQCSKHYSSSYKNQSLYAVSSTSHCLSSDKYKTQKPGVGRVYNSWMLDLLVNHITSRL